MPNVANIFVIIVTYKGHQWYERCFTSLRQSEVPVQTVVIDNASNDGTVEYIREHFPEVHLIESKENLGFGRANNIGMRYALDHGCDYVFLLNQDAWIESNSIKELVRIHHENPEYGILSPMHINAEKNHFNILFDDGDRNYNIASDFYFGIKKEVYKVKYVNAAAWLLPRTTLEVIGGFDPIFKHYEEDDDYLNRLQYHKINVGLCANITIVHDHTTFGNISNFQQTRREQYLLLDLLNLNKPLRVKSYLRYLVRKMVVSLLMCKIEQFHQYLKDYRFVVSKKDMIVKSRHTNALKAANWL